MTLALTDLQGMYVFPAGLPGFPTCQRFELRQPAGCDPLVWMVSLDHDDLAFAAVKVNRVVDSYHPRLSREDLADLDTPDPAMLITLALLTVSADPDEVTVNLRAPLILNPSTHIGRQAIVAGQEYSVRHHLRPAEGPK